MSERPLLEYAEGADQDDRSSLLSAFRRVVGSHRRREISDLHVRELLTYVLSADRDGRGVQLSYDDVANVLCCERSTARSIVQRAERDYGLLEVIEDRYARGGQAPNRYAINWPAVRAINRGQPADTTAHPADTTLHPAAPTAHPAATTAQPYKEIPLDVDVDVLEISLKTSTSTSEPAPAETKLDPAETFARIRETFRSAVSADQSQIETDRATAWKAAVAVCDELGAAWFERLLLSASRRKLLRPYAWLWQACERALAERGVDARQFFATVPVPEGLPEPERLEPPRPRPPRVLTIDEAVFRYRTELLERGITGDDLVARVDAFRAQAERLETSK